MSSLSDLASMLPGSMNDNDVNDINASSSSAGDGVQSRGAGSSSGKGSRSGASASASNKGKKPAMPKLKGMSREAYSLLVDNAVNSDAIDMQDISGNTISLDPSAVQQLPSLLPSILQGQKKIIIDPSHKVHKWEFKEFELKSRKNPGKNPVKHWQRSILVPTEYSFSKFNKASYVVSFPDTLTETHIEIITQFANKIFSGGNSDAVVWSGEEIKTLLNLCERYDLRWPVIIDRWNEMRSANSHDDSNNNNNDSIENYQNDSINTSAKNAAHLQGFYYKFAKSLLDGTFPDPSLIGLHNEKINHFIQTGRITAQNVSEARTSLLEFHFNIDHELFRMQQLDLLYKRTEEDNNVEKEILNGIREIDEEIMKKAEVKSKMRPSLLENAALKTIKTIEQAGSLDGSSDPRSDLIVGSSLRSHRFNLNVSNYGIGQKVTKKVTQMLQELHVPKRPLPTADVCEAYDSLRKDMIRVFLLQDEVRRKTNLLRTLRGEEVVEEQSASNTQNAPQKKKQKKS